MKSVNQTTQELKQFWNIPQLQFLAHYIVNKSGKGLFVSLRKQDGSACRFPDGRDITIKVLEGTYKQGTEYLIHAFVAPDGKRAELNLEYLLYLDTRNNPPKKLESSPQQDIQKLFRECQSAIGIVKEALIGSLKRLSFETNKKPETFIYELLQNADDYPDPQRKKVNIRFKITDKHLVVMHNGQPFQPNNVRALCSVAGGDKEFDFSKTGYKGIGFKSIFKHSNYVWVHSGGYSFRFDEEHHRRMGEETFWQVIPVWTELEDVDETVRTPDVINAPVSFVIKPKDGLSRLMEYEQTFLTIFKDERVLLFLRSVESLAFQSARGEAFSKSKSPRAWEISALDEIAVPENIREAINQQIGKGLDERIPEKYRDIETTSISFATVRQEGKISVTENSRVYAYLPTDLNFGFLFLINGDFIPDGSREKLFWDIEWNQFLFREAGKQLLIWLKELWLRHQDGNCVRLLPDLERLIKEEKDRDKQQFLRYFQEGFLEGMVEVSFVPDVNGKLYLPSELLTDETGLCALLGEDTFRRLTGEQLPVMHTDFADNPVLYSIAEKKKLGFVFTLKELLEAVKEQAFQEWLADPVNNLSFLKLLDKNGWMASFSNVPIFLDQNGTLQDATSLYYSLEDDEDLLHWMNVPVLHGAVRKGLGKIDLPVQKYEPVSFIENYVLLHKETIDSFLDEWENSQRFYQYLFQYHESLLEKKFFIENKLLYFKVFDAEGVCLSSFQESTMYLFHSDAQMLLDNSSVPEGHFYLLDPLRYAPDGETEDWEKFWKKFGVKSLKDTSWQVFIQQEIISCNDTLVEHYVLSPSEDEGTIEWKKNGNKHLWLFLNKVWPHIPSAEEKALEQQISRLPVFTDGGVFRPLKECYLSQSYTSNAALESFAAQHPRLQITFVSGYYAQGTELSTKNWLDTFRRFHVKTDEKDIIVQHIIPDLANVPDDDLVATTRLLFRHQNHIEEQLPNLSLKVKTKAGAFVFAKDAVIGPHYSQTTLISDMLPGIGFENEISDEYGDKKQTEWVTFFQKLGAQHFPTEREVIAAKIKKCIEDKLPLKSVASNLAIVKELVELHKAQKLSDEDYILLSSMYLLRKPEKENMYRQAGLCHLSKEYNPEVNLEELLADREKPEIFVSPVYTEHCDSLSDLKSFFKNIGVKSYFFILEVASKKRADIDPRYINFIDGSYPSIKSNAQQGWAVQHYVAPWIELQHHEYLNNFSLAKLFWENVRSKETFRAKIFEMVTYHTHYTNTKVDNYILWYLKDAPCFPAADGNCYKPSFLFSAHLSPVISDKSKVPAVDLSKITFKEKSLEEWLGFKMNLTLDVCLQSFVELKDIGALKKLKIWEKVRAILTDKSYRLSSEESAALSRFASHGYLPNQLGEWKPVAELFSLKEGFDLGIGRQPKLVHKDLASLAPLFGIKVLKEEDFEPEFTHHKKDGFKERLSRHLKYVAVAENSQGWSQLEMELQAKISKLEFWTTTGIRFCYKKTSPPIENTEITFHVQGENIYYVGRWNGPWSANLFGFLHKLFGSKAVSVKALTDLILYEEDEVLTFFEEKHIPFPEEWRPKKVSPLQPSSTIDYSVGESTSSGPKEPDRRSGPITTAPSFEPHLSEVEVAELEKLLQRSLSEDEMANILIIALFRALKHYEGRQYDVSYPKAHFEEAVRKRMLEGVKEPGAFVTIRVIVRSARKGVLRLNYQAWYDLMDADTELFVVTGNNDTDHEIFPDQKSLAEHNTDSWVAKIGGEDKYSELCSLVNGEYAHPEKKFSPVQFLIRVNDTREYQSIFEPIFSKEDNPNFDDLD